MKKRTSYFSLFCAAAICSCSLLSPVPWGGTVRAASPKGDGSAETPYLITTAEELREFSRIVAGGDYDAHGILQADITLSGDWTPVGGSDASAAYTGTFQGEGHTITFFSVDSRDYMGLFSYNSGTVENVTVAGTVSGTEYAGGIAAVNSGTIRDCKNVAAVSSSSPVSFAGGIAGVNIGTISESENTGEISSPASGSNVGGIAGAAREGAISDCTNRGSIRLTPQEAESDYAEGGAGGITGLNYQANIERSGNYASVTNQDASGYTGGIAGLNNGSISNCVNGSGIEGSYFAGGVAGYNFLNEEAGDALIHSTLNHGKVISSSQNSGAVCGVNHAGTIYDSYYLEGTASAGIGASDNSGTTPKTAEALKSGEVTYQLNGNQSASPVWYQTLDEDAFPVLDDAHGTVYRTSSGESVSYTNDKEAHTDHEFGDDGACDICGYQSVSLYGHSLTLDGATGLNYYYYLDPMYYQDDTYSITVSFTVNGRTTTDTFDPSSVSATGDEEAPQVYGFQVYLNSDEMTVPVKATLEIQKDSETVVTLSDDESFRGYDYLKELYENKDGQYSKELQDLAQALATYDYYANEQFQYQDSYEPKIPLMPIDGVTEETVRPFQQTVADQESYPAKHYALSMQFLSEHVLYLYITSEDPLDTSRLYMGYKTHGSAEGYQYVPAQKYGNYYRAATRKTPASELDTMWDCAFFLQKEDGSYEQITAIKTAGPLSYAVSALRPSTKPSVQKLNQALYLYYQTTKTYFDSISQE